MFFWTQVVVGNSANWVEAAKTLTELAQVHRIQMNEPIYFNEPYVGLDQMPSVVDRTYRFARSEYILAVLSLPFYSVLDAVFDSCVAEISANCYILVKFCVNLYCIYFGFVRHVNLLILSISW